MKDLYYIDEETVQASTKALYSNMSECHDVDRAKRSTLMLWVDAELTAIKECFDISLNSKILDLGCGTGRTVSDILLGIGILPLVRLG